MTPKPAIGTQLRDRQSGHESVVVEHTVRGFRYRGQPRSFIPRWEMVFSGEGEIFTDLDWYDWSVHYETIEPTHDL